MTARMPLVLLLLVVQLALIPAAASAQSQPPEPTSAPVVPASPAPTVAPDAGAGTDRVASLMAGMSLREKVGQLFMSRVYGYRADDPAPGAVRANEAELGVADARELFERFPVGAVVYFEYAGNLQHPQQVARLSNGIQRAALDAGTVPVLIGTDQEHGRIERLGPPATRFPGNMALGATRDADLARAAARVTGKELRAVGIVQDLAPVADVNSDPANPVIGLRSFGSRPRLVAEMTAAQVVGFERDAGVAATVKHFPGHGDTDIDSHVGLPTVKHGRQTWWELDAPPFVAAVEAGVDVVMTAHVRVPALDPSGLPATLSQPILTGILREQMAFDGVIMTDSLTMAAVRERFGDERVPVLALKAGADLLADPPHLPTAFRAVMDAVSKGELSEARIDSSVERILRLKERLGLLDEPFVAVEAVAATLGSRANLAVAQAVGEAAVTVLADDGGWLPLKRRWRVLLTGPRPEGASALSRGLADAGHAVTVAWTAPDPGRAATARAKRRARRHDVTIVVTDRLGALPGQRRLVTRLLATGRRVVVVYAGSPYDASWFPAAPTALATYATVPVSMRGLASVLSGEVSATGRLPVRVPRPARGTLFSFGHGLTP